MQPCQKMLTKQLKEIDFVSYIRSYYIHIFRVLYVLSKFEFLINIKDPSAVFVKYIFY